MGCLHGKEQEDITEPYEQRDPWWNMIKSADLSLAYMRELDERITIVEVSNRSNEKKIGSKKKGIEIKTRRTDKMRRKEDVLNR